VRQREWIAGRVALRAALEHQALDDGAAILRDDRGAPRTPERAVASLSHKGQWAAALAAPRRHGCSLGIDLEQKAGPRVDIAARVCTQRELASLAPLGQAERGHAITLRFSAKEAVYKAIDPWLRRYVGFREVEVDLWPDGTGRAVAVAPALIGELGAAGVELTWESVGEHWLCTARATR
jgi:enterobactin synthetase component D